MQTEAETAPERTLDRRTLIKRAAAAGAVAWTAPVLINSLDSPAAAATGGCACAGCFYVEFIKGICSDTNNQYHSDPSGSHPCQPNYSTVSGCTNCVPFTTEPATDICINTQLLPATQCKEDLRFIKWTIVENCTTDTTPPRTNCRFVSGVGQAEDGQVSCITGSITDNGHTIEFDRGEEITETNRWTEFRVILCCDAVPA
jgi:hypothetical protein